MDPRPLYLLHGATLQAGLWSPITVITEMRGKDRCMLGIRAGHGPAVDCTLTMYQALGLTPGVTIVTTVLSVAVCIG